MLPAPTLPCAPELAEVVPVRVALPTAPERPAPTPTATEYAFATGEMSASALTTRLPIFVPPETSVPIATLPIVAVVLPPALMSAIETPPTTAPMPMPSVYGVLVPVGVRRDDEAAVRPLDRGRRVDVRVLASRCR